MKLTPIIWRAVLFILLGVRGRDSFAILFTRTSRFIREAGLTWAIVLGLDGWLSQEAEEAE